MAQGEFTVEEAIETETAVTEMFDAIPKSKRGLFVGHLNDALLFIQAAKAFADKAKAAGSEK